MYIICARTRATLNFCLRAQCAIPDFENFGLCVLLRVGFARRRCLPSRKRRRVNEHTEPSAVAGLLAEEVGSGSTHVNAAVKIAAAMQADVHADALPSMLQDWASLGGASNKRSNVERDLHRWLRLQQKLGVEISWMPLTVFTKGGLGREEVLHPFLEPHRLVSAIYAAGRKQFERSLLGEDAVAPQDFWEHCARELPPWFVNHPARHRKAEWGKLIPLRVHGDEARFCKQSKLLVLQTASAFAGGTSSWDTKLVFTTIASERLIPHVTIPQLLRRMAASLNVLGAGRHPEMDLDGKPFAPGSAEHKRIGEPIAGPFSFCWIGLKGDNEFIQVVTQSSRWYMCNFVCRRCFASRKVESLLYTDVSDEPGWLETLTNTEHYLRATPENERCPRRQRAPRVLDVFSMSPARDFQFHANCARYMYACMQACCVVCTCALCGRHPLVHFDGYSEACVWWDTMHNLRLP